MLMCGSATEFFLEMVYNMRLLPNAMEDVDRVVAGFRQWKHTAPLQMKWVVVYRDDNTAQTDELPDENIITVGAEDFHCTKVLFQPCFSW